MPDYLEYQKSVAQEFKALENRVRNLIDAANWPEEGRYKEVLLINYLKRILPNNISVGTGFVKSNNNISTQIDIIIYKNSFPTLFKEGDFVIVWPESVLGIIEVKTNIKSSEIEEIIRKSNENGKMIIEDDNKKRNIFNGIFSFNITNDIDAHQTNIKKIAPLDPIDENSLVNNISLGEDYFIRFWDSCAYPTEDAFSYNIYRFSDTII